MTKGVLIPGKPSDWRQCPECTYVWGIGGERNHYGEDCPRCSGLVQDTRVIPVSNKEREFVRMKALMEQSPDSPELVEEPTHQIVWYAGIPYWQSPGFIEALPGFNSFWDYLASRPIVQQYFLLWTRKAIIESVPVKERTRSIVWALQNLSPGIEISGNFKEASDHVRKMKSRLRESLGPWWDLFFEEDEVFPNDNFLMVIRGWIFPGDETTSFLPSGISPKDISHLMHELDLRDLEGVSNLTDDLTEQRLVKELAKVPQAKLEDTLKKYLSSVKEPAK